MLFQQDFFERQAGLTPDAIAVEDEGFRITYGALEAQANRIAHLLRRCGCCPNDRVGIFLNKGISAYATILGTLKSGACWVPLSYNYPYARLLTLLRLLRPSAVVVESRSLLPVVSARQALVANSENNFSIINVEGVSDLSQHIYGETEIASQLSDRPDRTHMSPEDLAYIMFTSGSTGEAKGVMVLHRNTTQFLALCPEFFGIPTGARFAHFAELTFDPSIFDLFHAWGTGGTVVPMKGRRYRIDTASFLIERQPNVLFCVPSALKGLRERGEISDPRLNCLSHLLLTGEVVPPNMVRDWYDHHPHCRIFNMYGTTETAIVSHWYEVPRNHPLEYSVPVGRHLPGIRILLIRQDGKLASVNESGESLVYGNQVSPGYWANQEQTQARWISHPLEPGLPQRFYRSGDQLKLEPDGVYSFIGRTDDQVKVRGHRVELTEVEAILCQHSEVLEAGVVPFGHDADSVESLVAFVLLRSPVALKAVQLFLNDRLPTYMVPNPIYVIEDSLPENINGKLDRQQLMQWAVKRLNK